MSRVHKYPFLFRLNEAPVSGYTRDVGSKTTMRITYPEGAFQTPERYEKDSLFVFSAFKPLDFKWLRHMIFREKLVRTSYIVLLDLYRGNVSGFVTVPHFPPGSVVIFLILNDNNQKRLHQMKPHFIPAIILRTLQIRHSPAPKVMMHEMVPLIISTFSNEAYFTYTVDTCLYVSLPSPPPPPPPLSLRGLLSFSQ